MPVTTVFEIGEGRFTVVLYPETTSTTSNPTSAGAIATANSGLGSGAGWTTRQTTRTATKSIEANIHQVSTSLSPTPTDQSDISGNAVSNVVNETSTGVWGETTTVLEDGVTYTASPDVVTWTSGSGVYTTEVWGLVPEQESEGSETGVEGMNKNILTTIITASVLTVILGFLASLGGCWWYRRRRRRRRRTDSGSDPRSTSSAEAGAMGEKRERLSRLDMSGVVVRSSPSLGPGSASGTGSGSAGPGSSSSTGAGSSGRWLLADGSEVRSATTLTGTNSTGAGEVMEVEQGRTRALSVTESAIGETVSIAEGTVTPFTLPVGFLMPPHRDERADVLLTRGGRRADTSSVSNISTEDDDDDAFAIDGDSIARTLSSTSSLRHGQGRGRGRGRGRTLSSTSTEDPFDSPIAWGGGGGPPPAYEAVDPSMLSFFGQGVGESIGSYETTMMSGSGTGSTSNPNPARLLDYRMNVAGAAGGGSSQDSHAPFVPRSMGGGMVDRQRTNPFADPTAGPSTARPTRSLTVIDPNSRRYSASSLTSSSARSDLVPMSEAGRSERSNPQTEASYARGDDQTINVGPKWIRRPGSYGGWSESTGDDEGNDSSDDEGTVIAGSDRRIVLGDDESWVNGSEYGRRTRARGKRNDDDVFGDAHRAA